jgi:hypothetical protein
MLWPLRLALGLVLRFKAVIVSVLAGMVIAFYLQVREQHHSWGIVSADVGRVLAGDDIIEDADIVETRTITLDAAPSAVWPWLVQMGYGRGGWYSYDRLDMEGRSADAILPQFQGLGAGDLVPTHPGGGFVARVVDPPKALVLYLDSELARSQVEALVGAGETGPVTTEDHAPVGLHLAGTLGGMSMPEFRTTWSFILEPEADGTRTRLIERFRVKAADTGLAQRLSLPVMGLGVFAMTRKHMLGLKERAEGMATSGNGAHAPEAQASEA